ncbi:TPA: hypothetical protein DCW38_02135 [candidate division WOR-3 bacterium]|uniref:Glycosyltransferase RgtA/B/C/D-like domain-containing protein n=1 Tax=candidate division WOR-3 bacterium TaxID=2052148 RepID=A0A350H8U7_UNCW3|nr:hypothetical protein [candidate division WOR-3 bacterium]
MKKNKGMFLLLLFSILYLAIEFPLLTTITKVWVDEPWYAGTAYNFSQGHGFTNENVVGLYGGDVLFGYPLFLGAFMKIFGSSLFACRMFSLMCGYILLVIMFFILRELTEDMRVIFVFYLLFIFSSTVYIVFRTIRPEAIKIIFSSMSLLFLVKAYKGKPLLFAVSGFLIVAGALCHPDELIFAFVFLIIIAAYSIKIRNYRPVLYYSAGATATIFIFVFFLHVYKNMTLYDFYIYYGRRLSVYDSSLIGDLILKFNNIIKDYALGFKRLFILIFEIGMPVWGLFYFKKNKRIYYLSLIGILFFTISFVFLERIVTRGFISIILYSILIFALIFQEEMKRKKILFIVIGIGAVYLLNNFAAISFLILRDRENTPYSVIEKKIDNMIDDDAVVLSHLNFYFPMKNNIFYNDYTIYSLTNAVDIDSRVFQR